MKTLAWGILLLILVGVGGVIYRNAVENSARPIACPLDAKICPDGTSVGRTGLSCTFPACPPPNVSLHTAGIAFALPNGFVEAAKPDSVTIANYDLSAASSTDSTSSPQVASIVIRRYSVAASSTPLATIEETAIGAASGAPVSPTSFTSVALGSHRFTAVLIERFEGVVDTAYYLARGADVLRFDAIDRGADWTNPNLNISKLPAHAALSKLLATLQSTS